MNGDFINQRPQAPQSSPQMPANGNGVVQEPAPAQPAYPVYQKPKRSFLKFLLLIVLLAAAAGGVYYWQQMKIKDLNSQIQSLNSENSALSNQLAAASAAATPKDETADWKVATTSQKAFTIKIPDGWKVSNYAKSDFIAAASSADLSYQKGTAATITDVATPHDANSPVAFSTSYTDATSLPKPVGTESDFALGTLSGKKYSQVYTVDTGTGALAHKKGDKTYEYRFTLTNGKAFVLVYNVRGTDTDQVDLVEKALKTVNIAQ